MRQNLNGVIGEIDSLPGCSQIAVSHSVFLPGWHKMETRGQGTLANEQRLDFAFNELGYDAIVCTVQSDNMKQIAILTTNGWQKSFGFKSRKTGHLVELWYKLEKHRDTT